MSELLQKSCWSVEDREVMLSAAASKVEAAHAKRVRRPMQDYTTLPHFLPSKLCAEITTQSETADKRLHMLCQHASLLGLKYPSENTVGVIIGLCMHKQLTSASPREMHDTSRRCGASFSPPRRNPSLRNCRNLRKICQSRCGSGALLPVSRFLRQRMS